MSAPIRPIGSVPPCLAEHFAPRRRRNLEVAVEVVNSAVYFGKQRLSCHALTQHFAGTSRSVDRVFGHD